MDGEDVEPEGEEEVCPDQTTEYELTVQFPDQARLENETVEITVKKNDGDDDE